MEPRKGSDTLLRSCLHSLSSFQWGPIPRGSTSPKHNRLRTKPSIHRSLGDIRDPNYEALHYLWASRMQWMRNTNLQAESSHIVQHTSWKYSCTKKHDRKRDDHWTPPERNSSHTKLENLSSIWSLELKLEDNAQMTSAFSKEGNPSTEACFSKLSNTGRI